MTTPRPPLSVEAARALFLYDRAVFDRFVDRVERLPSKASRRSRGIGHLSLFDTLVHILNVHEAWLVGAAQGNWKVFEDPRRRKQNVRSFADLHEYRRRVWHATDPLAAKLTDRALVRRVHVPWMPGHYTLEDAFFQASFEQAHHLGEIIGAYWRENRTPPQMMWIPTLLGTRVSVR